MEWKQGREQFLSANSTFGYIFLEWKAEQQKWLDSTHQRVFVLFRCWNALSGDLVNSQTKQLFLHSKKVKEAEDTYCLPWKRKHLGRESSPIISQKGWWTKPHSPVSFQAASPGGLTHSKLPPETCSLGGGVSRAVDTPLQAPTSRKVLWRLGRERGHSLF